MKVSFSAPHFWCRLQRNEVSEDIPYQNIRSLVYISRKYAANLQHVCGLYLRRVCRKRVFRMQITFLAHCSGTQCAPQVCCAQLSRTVLAHNVRRKFAAHSCRTLYWHTMCAESMQRTVVAHYSGTQCAPQVCSALLSHTILVCLNFAAHSCRALRCSAPPLPYPPLPPPPPHPWFITPTAIFFFSSLPPEGVWEKMWGW